MTCLQYRDVMVAFVQGELPGLAGQRVASHLGHCAGCRTARDRLSRSLAAARAYDPEISPEHLARLSDRLAPYVEAAAMRRSAPRRWALVALGAATVSVAIAAVLGARFALLEGPRAPRGSPAAVSWEAARQPARLAPSPYVRALVDAEWDGREHRHGADLEYTATRGRGAFAFRGGDGRRLRVHTPFGSVEAVGTRFMVGLTAEALTVSVAEGRVAVRTGRGVTYVEASQQVSVGPAGIVWHADASPEGYAWCRHPYLDEIAALAPAGRATEAAATEAARAEQRPARRAAPEARRAALERTAELSSAPQGGDDLAGRIAEAEALARSGRARESLAIYERCAAAGGGTPRAYAELCRYEAGRLYGFALGEPARARAMFAALAKSGQGEARRQALLAGCELDRAALPCRAARCLRALAADRHLDVDLGREAARLLEHWKLDEACAETEASR